MEHCGVVDRKELENALACLCSPVHHLLEIIELTYSEVILAAEREHRDRRAGSSPCPSLEVHLEVCLNHELILLRKRREPSVLAALPSQRLERVLVCDHDLVCERLGHIEGKCPYREVRAVERNDLCPVLEGLAAACQREDLIRSERRCSHLDEHIGTLRSLLCLLGRSAEDG